MIGGVAALGLGLYSVVKKQNNVIISGQENWEGINKIIDQLGSSNSAFLESITQILQSSGSGGSSTPGGGSSTPGGGSSELPGGSEENGNTLEDTKEVLKLTSTALNKLGYSGTLVQAQTLLKESVDKDKVAIASNPGLNAIEGGMSVASTGNDFVDDMNNKIYTVLQPVSVLKPSNLSTVWNGLHGFGEWVYNTATGKKNVDDELAVN